ncbi:MAG TPA: cbb3-type cytochrome c oxidase subunit II [Bryobacteraceae bacterium]|nr:cbb3-type cytochrome c oxidase subunit II [Bryobacteraceae bacterium]
MKRALRMSYLVAGVAGLGFFAMSVLLLAVWPGRVLEEQVRRMSPGHPLGLTDSEGRGRRIYAREGCAYCHTQQIRYVASDVARFGGATLAWETIFDYPHLWGTRRIGPDLSREGATRSADWQLSHLYSPRSMVQGSVMPAFVWLFDGAPDRPKQEGLDLLAYVETLGRDRALAAPEGESRARAACDCSEDERRFAFGSAVLNASPALARRQGDHPRLAPSGDSTKGQQVYSRDCATCHGTRGEGDGPGAVGLHPHPANLAEHEYTLDRLSFALWNGVAGTGMPAWRDLPLADLAAAAAVVRGFHAPQPEPAIPEAVLAVGAKVYAARCAQCHGENGAGDGYAVSQFAVAPTNFRTQRPSLAVSLRAVRDGIEGTPMAPWSNELSEAELSAVAYYVRGFFEGQ